MSHYSVLVIGEDIDEKLKPFDEGLEVPKYVVVTKEQIITKKRLNLYEFKTKHYDKYTENSEEYIKNCKNEDHLNYLQNTFLNEYNQSDEELYLEGIKYKNPEMIGANGEVYSTYNPNSKWDWYETGGRFKGMLRTKAGEKTSQGLKKDLDLPTSGYAKPIEELQKDWDELMEDSLKTITLERFINFEGFVKNHNRVITYAVIDQKGNWHSPGTMGWWGFSSESDKDWIEWRDSFYDRFITPLDGNTLLTIIDCHI